MNTSTTIRIALLAVALSAALTGAKPADDVDE